MMLDTEDKIERYVEREMNMLDRAYFNGDLDEKQYDFEVRALDRWAREQYRWVKSRPDF